MPKHNHMSGLQGKVCHEDEQLLLAIRRGAKEAYSEDEISAPLNRDSLATDELAPLLIVDCRPMLNAEANRFVGKGSENVSALGYSAAGGARAKVN